MVTNLYSDLYIMPNISKIYIGENQIWPSTAPTPTEVVFDYDFTTSDEGFSTIYTVDGGISGAYESGYGWWCCINRSVTSETMAYIPLKSELYTAGTPKKIEFTTSGTNGGAGLCVNAQGARGRAINSSAGYNGNYLNITTFDGTHNTIASGLNNFVGHKITMDFETGTISAEGTNVTMTFDKNYYLQQWENKTLAICIVGYGSINEKTYLSSAKFTLESDSPTPPTPPTPGVLPSEYQEVEYVHSDANNTPYINTGYICNSNTVINTEVLWSTTQPSSYWCIFFGACSNDDSPDGVQLRTYDRSTSQINAWFCNSSYSECSPNAAAETWHTIELKSGALVLDGTSNTITTTGTPWNGSLYLFAGHDGSRGTFRPGNCSLKEFVITENGTTVLDLIPCYRISDNVVGFYDLIGEQFLTNNGGGSLTAGPDVN